MAEKSKVVKIFDGFKNIMKGLGTNRDPRMYTQFQKGRIIAQAEASALYTYNWLARKCVNIPIDDAVRKWRVILEPDADKKEALDKLEVELKIKDHIALAAKWARVYGGAAIVIVIDGEDIETPINFETIREGADVNFIVLDRYNIVSGPVENMIMSKNFGMPEYYTVARDGQKIHYTRVIKFFGEISTLTEFEQANYWGNSLYCSLFDPIAEAQTTFSSIANLVFEASVDVYRINGLNALVAEGNDELVVKRLKLANELKSVINGIALDKEDEYEKKQVRFSELDDIDDRAIQKVAGASDIPVTRLLGISPSGMNATGESDMLNYHDKVQSIQDNVLRPNLVIIDKIMARIVGTEEYEFEFRPLKQLTEVEQASVTLSRAQRDQVYLDNNVLKSSDILAQLAEDGTYVSVDENRVEEERNFEQETETINFE